MSKYHERIAAIAAERDWTTVEGVAVGLRDRLELRDYGIEFQIWRDDLPLNETAARRLIIDKVTTRPVSDAYLAGLQDMTRQGREDLVDGGVTAHTRGTRLMFEHGDFKYPVNFSHSNPELEVVIGQKDVARRLKRRTKTEVGREERSNRLQEKLDDTRNADRAGYLAHASQCGYLVRHTAMRFYNKARGQRGVSTMTSITGLALPKLQGFIDSTGRESLSEVSTHVDTSLEKVSGPGAPEGPALVAMHADFAKEIVDFLNLEYEVDIDDLKRRHMKDDSGFQSIGHWIEQSGGGSGIVLEKLLDRRPDSAAADDITKAFEAGYAGKLPEAVPSA